MPKAITFSIRKSEQWIGRKLRELQTKTGLNRSLLICRLLGCVLDKALEDPGILLHKESKK